MINLLQATAPAPQAGGSYSLFIMLGLMISGSVFLHVAPRIEATQADGSIPGRP